MNFVDPELFRHHFSQLMAEIYHLMECVREKTLAPEENGVARYHVESGKTCFQVAGQFDRAAEFLQSLLDMIRVMYEPNPPGTFFLNANWGFLMDETREDPFQLGYLSVMSNPKESISDFYARAIAPKMTECCYIVEAATAMFVMVTQGSTRSSLDNIGEIQKFFNAGFSVEDALGCIAAEVKGESPGKIATTYVGFSTDEAMGDRLRFSMWLFFPQCHYH